MRRKSRLGKKKKKKKSSNDGDLNENKSQQQKVSSDSDDEGLHTSSSPPRIMMNRHPQCFPPYLQGHQQQAKRRGRARQQTPHPDSSALVHHRHNAHSSPSHALTNKKPHTATAHSSALPSDVYFDLQAHSSTHPPVQLLPIDPQHHIYVCDIGLSRQQCQNIILATESACHGQYSAYTYAKQTLGCREYLQLAELSSRPVRTACAAIRTHHPTPLALDDREPHIVKYDVTKKERQKLDMHTDKSEWTFLIALSQGGAVDYVGGGTYFEASNSVVHIEQGQALIFPGRLRHRGEKITHGSRYLLVGFLVHPPGVSPADVDCVPNVIPSATTNDDSLTPSSKYTPTTTH